ncbi:GntR family transcriptional regulator [Pseudomonas capeferrum]|uniref:GntR family transcriptional regulator n=1 Tax=Pseudomonas capeferrum TaxID=1495066 RepID=UPI0015E38CE5|nr:GntR family transcriptional regulator [Pseudomonas capeferrum]MBA1200967.1 GntR family transcriptional regulator [Pseudomonas capeferrum]
MQLLGPHGGGRPRPENLVEQIYAQLKDDIFEFRLIPGDRFSETEVAERMQVSRTPVRQALHRLEREGYLIVLFRSGWQVRAFDFTHFEELYDVRIVLELEAVRRLCERPEGECPAALESLRAIWLVAPEARLRDGREVSRLDERFHCQLVEAAGNAEMARLHARISEQIRIIRRLDFTQGPRVTLTYEEHGRILAGILERRSDEAQRMLQAHIEVSKAEVRKITLHMLHTTRARAMAGGEG